MLKRLGFAVAAVLLAGNPVLAATRAAVECLPVTQHFTGEPHPTGSLVCPSNGATAAGPTPALAGCVATEEDRLVALHRTIRDGGLGGLARIPAASGSIHALGRPVAAVECRAG